METDHPHVLLLSGTGRNCGKTTAACRLIRKVSDEEKVTAIKISPHFHEVDYPTILAKRFGDYAIYKENRQDRPKDSSRMLAAGADTVYYVQARNECLQEVWSVISGWLDPGKPVIIEAGGLQRLIRPGILFLLRHGDPYKPPTERIDADNYIIAHFEELDSIIRKVIFNNGRWLIHEGYDDIR